MSQNTEDLSKFRSQIDAIDDKIIDLLKDRLEIVRQVGKHKAKTSATLSFIRAGREANMLRDLTHKINEFPPAAIANIWRMIISTSLCTEQDMSISAYATENNRDCYWLAREYYGSFVRTQKVASVEEVISNVATGKTSIGVLPLQNEGNPWWLRPSGEKNNIYIFARIPFVEDSNQDISPALAIANVMPEPTQNDISLIVLHSSQGIEKINAAFASNHLKSDIIAQYNNCDYLIQTDKFLPVGDARLTSIADILGEGSSIRLMGAYAAPIVIG
jgi:chorismate mutase/prephenate dehydratase